MSCSTGLKQGNKKSMIAPKTKIFWIKQNKNLCYHESADLCYSFKESFDGNWQVMYGFIDGFDYKWGNEYKLELKIHANENLKDELDHYELVKILKNKSIQKPFEMILADSENVTLRNLAGKYSVLNSVTIDIPSDLIKDVENLKVSDQEVVGQVGFQYPSGELTLLKILKN